MHFELIRVTYGPRKGIYIIIIEIMKTLHDVYVSELRDIYYAEKMIAEELPRMANKATAPELKVAFEKHAEETKVHVERLEKIFDMLELAHRGKTCHAIE